MKITFGMIVFEGDYVLRQCLEQVYPFANQILISQGPVTFWQNLGKTTSEDQTNEILAAFPDPEGKIKIVNGQFKEKDDQSNAYLEYIDPNTDYLWNLDCDEVYKTGDLENAINYLKIYKPTSVGVQSCSFYGGFDRFLTGFELRKDNFLRIFKYTEGANWLTHRPPTIRYPQYYTEHRYHVSSEQFLRETGVQMYHYSYVYPSQVFKKAAYYKSSVSKSNCIDDYFFNVYFPWVRGSIQEKQEIENQYQGVHEFKPEVRGPCYTELFQGTHPETIQRDMALLRKRVSNEMEVYDVTNKY